ncbi:g_PROTEIN_RECEP_F1_2 domain-containing protein [Caerostris darwini]|uniref:G_PROTEIN_RECEP_F1_2 domain-containing protein n=1 Tax=Caerostris darwini TaxID=1538125 RepID=A0AAV4RMJ5_9ARAC|nr:g_PROTEIN_RECEP_F1_2 domain-containing protein [Caerostris darwini]
MENKGVGWYEPQRRHFGSTRPSDGIASISKRHSEPQVSLRYYTCSLVPTGVTISLVRMATKEDVPKNDSKTVQVTVVIFYNGTYPAETDPALEIVLLVVVFLVSFGTNIFLLVTIASSYTLRKVPFNLLFSNLCVTFLLESVWNMTVALLYVSMDAWKLGHTGCAFSSFVVQLVTLEVTFCLCLMCAEGMLSVWQPFRFQTYLTIKKQIVVIVTMWTAGVLLCMPLLVKSMTSRMFPARYNCAPAGPDGFAHAIFLTIWCYSLMIIIGFGCLLNLGIRQYKEYKIQKKKNSIVYSNVFMQGDLWTEWVNFKLVAWLALFYLLFELPYIIVHQDSALKTHPEESPASNGTSSSPVIECTHKYEKVFTWLRFIYSCVFALLVFKMRKDIRQKLKELFHCCHRKGVRDNSAGLVVRQDIKKSTKKDSVVPLSLNTPVLYISPDGLCLRQLDANKYSNEHDKNHPKFVSYLCDHDGTEDSRSNSQNSFNSNRRFSKESEATLPDMGSGSSYNGLSDIPMGDIPTSVLEPEIQLQPPPPKKVRFADTLTIYHNVSPRNKTPEWVVSTQKIASVNKKTTKRRGSKIPTRIRKTDNVTPWKNELNSTYKVNNPIIETQILRQIVNEVKRNSIYRSNSLSRNNTNNRKKIRRNSVSPPQWKINKLS